MKNVNKENVFDLLESLIGTKIDETEENISLLVEKSSSIIIKINKAKVLMELEDLNTYSIQDAALYNKNNFLVALKSNYSPFYREEFFNTLDQQNKIQYSIIKMPLLYFFIIMDIFLEENKNIEELKRLRINRVPYPFLLRRLEESENNELSLNEYINHFFRINVIKIESEIDKKADEFFELLSSYIFTISYNYRDVFVPHKTISDLFPKRTFNSKFRNNIVRNKDDFDPPRRKYKNELVSHYQMALVSETPYLEFLSYYHVIEHFFDSVIDEELIEKVKNKITMPDFSYKRNKDIKELVKLINNTTQIKNNNTVYNELNALKLTLKKYINLSELKNDFSPDYLDFLKNSKVMFSEGSTVNFDNSDIDNVYAELSKRIYNTRNALVHSKEMETTKYKPFNDDKILSKEIPLIKAIAEKIIIETANDL